MYPSEEERRERYKMLDLQSQAIEKDVSRAMEALQRINKEKKILEDIEALEQ